MGPVTQIFLIAESRSDLYSAKIVFFFYRSISLLDATRVWLNAGELTEMNALVVRVHFILTAQKIKFSINDFSSKCDQIRRKLGIWSHLLKKPLMKNFIFLCSAFNFCQLSQLTILAIGATWNTFFPVYYQSQQTQFLELPWRLILHANYRGWQPYMLEPCQTLYSCQISDLTVVVISAT